MIPRTHSITNQHKTRILSPTDQKCEELSTYWQFYYRPPGKFRYTVGEIVKCDANRYIYIYIYDPLHNRYGFSISFQPEIDCIVSKFLFNAWKENVLFLIFKSWQVCDWFTKWLIMLGFMDLRWPRVFFAFHCRSCFVFFRLEHTIPSRNSFVHVLFTSC